MNPEGPVNAPNQPQNQPVPPAPGATPPPTPQADPQAQPPVTVPPIPQPAAPATKKNKAIIIALAAVVVVIVGVALAVVFWWLPSQSSSNTSQQPNSSSNTDYSEKRIAFGLPAQPPANWTNDIFDQNGTFRYRSGTSCQFSFNQSLGVDESRSLGYTVEDAVQYWIDETKKAGAKSLTESASTDQIQLKTTPGETVQFYTKEATYTGIDSKQYTSKFASAWLGNTQLSIIVGCLSSDWAAKQSSINEFLGQTDIAVY